ncbi:MAG: hypothetical protein ABIO29_04910 [Sphingomicrobium sp.]
MNDEALDRALERAEFAIKRIERSLASRSAAPAASPGPDAELRAKVREAVAELDQLIREAAV